jgi:hypothetical protein
MVLYFGCGLLVASPLVTLGTAGFNLKNSTFCALSTFMCFVWILNSVPEEIKSRLKSGNVCLLSSSLLSKNFKN